MTLERDLRALADGFPEAPALAPRVLAAAQRASANRRRRRRVALLALALFLLVPATALAVSPDLRDRVLETFGLRDVKIEASPGCRARRRCAPASSSARASRWQGAQRPEARVSPPSVLGAPDGIFEERLESGVDVTFLYEPRTTPSASACAGACS